MCTLCLYVCSCGVVCMSVFAVFLVCTRGRYESCAPHKYRSSCGRLYCTQEWIRWSRMAWLCRPDAALLSNWTGKNRQRASLRENGFPMRHPQGPGECGVGQRASEFKMERECRLAGGQERGEREGGRERKGGAALTRAAAAPDKSRRGA